MEKLERKLERARSGESSGRASNALATFELTRPVVGASALGIAQAAYEWTLSYLDERDPQGPVGEYLDESSTAGRPPLERQATQQRLADVATEIEAARLLVQRASWMGRNGIPMMGGQGSMSKLKGGDVAMWATRTCMDLVGPYSQTMDCPLEKFFRDAKIYQLFEGTAEIQRMVVSRMQAAEYRERLKQGVEVAQEAIESASGSTNSAAPSGDGAVAAAGSQNGPGRAAQPRTPSAA
jgi:alkylation response protein AidB-like acyl-CoA dehydrogenase